MKRSSIHQNYLMITLELKDPSLFFIDTKKKVLDDLNKNPSYCFFYYYTTLPIIRTGWKISLHLQIYVLVDLKNLGRKIYTYNRSRTGT